MDAHRFDAFAKALAHGLTRRAALRRLAGGGAAASLLAAVGLGRSGAAAQEATPDTADTTTPAAHAAEGQICALPFEAAVRQGPSAGLELRGLLALQVGADGRIDQGALFQREEPRVNLVGQVTGRAISLLFTVGDGRYLYGVGVLEHDINRCEGAMGGPFVGPQLGDFGDWATRQPLVSCTSCTADECTELDNCSRCTQDCAL